jgi:cytochrome b subunit of formate dehydrogenase
MTTKVFDWKLALSIFVVILTGGAALFFGFAPYDWLCEYVKGTRFSCNRIPHGWFFGLATAAFMLSAIAYRQFDVRQVFLGRGPA